MFVSVARFFIFDGRGLFPDTAYRVTWRALHRLQTIGNLV
jgi:hypothetical protein